MEEEEEVDRGSRRSLLVVEACVDFVKLCCVIFFPPSHSHSLSSSPELTASSTVHTLNRLMVSNIVVGRRWDEGGKRVGRGGLMAIQNNQRVIKLIGVATVKLLERKMKEKEEEEERISLQKESVIISQ